MNGQNLAGTGALNNANPGNSVTTARNATNASTGLSTLGNGLSNGSRNFNFWGSNFLNSGFGNRGFGNTGYGYGNSGYGYGGYGNGGYGYGNGMYGGNNGIYVMAYIPGFGWVLVPLRAVMGMGGMGFGGMGGMGMMGAGGMF